MAGRDEEEAEECDLEDKEKEEVTALPAGRVDSAAECNNSSEAASKVR